MNYKLRIKKSRNTGYTIIETMIAVSLFLVIVMAGMGALLNANLLHQKSQDMRSVMDNLSFVMEDMSRNLRTGTTYHCVTDPADLLSSAVVLPKSGKTCWGIAFESANGNKSLNDDQWVYLIDNGKILKLTKGPYDVVASSYIQLTPDEVQIDNTASSFSVLGAEGANVDSQQPFATIRLVGKIKLKNNDETSFSLQTSVSQRLIDI